mgnify:FL=1
MGKAFAFRTAVRLKGFRLAFEQPGTDAGNQADAACAAASGAGNCLDGKLKVIGLYLLKKLAAGRAAAHASLGCVNLVDGEKAALGSGQGQRSPARWDISIISLLPAGNPAACWLRLRLQMLKSELRDEYKACFGRGKTITGKRDEIITKLRQYLASLDVLE